MRTVGSGTDWGYPGGRGSNFAHAARTQASDPECGLQVAERVDCGPVDPHLKVEVRAGARARVARIADDLALADRAARGDRVAGLMAVTGGEASAVVDAGVVPVAARVGSEDDCARGGREDRRPLGHSDVDSLVHAAPAV